MTNLTRKSILKNFCRQTVLKCAFVLLMSLSYSSGIIAQMLKGEIKDVEGKPIPFTTIYIEALATGSTSNAEGFYELNLTAGNYKVVFRSVGFNRVEKDIEIGTQDVVLNIVMSVQKVRLKEVRVFSGNEDPAYPIMRKVIAMTPYYQKQVDAYKAEVYLKGVLDMKKLPFYIRKSLDINGEGVKQGELYMVESFNEIEFNAPNSYKHKVISSHGSFPGIDGQNPLSYVSNNIYDTSSDDIISPLHPRAFSHYKYIYEGFFEDNGYVVNKIKVVSKRKSQQLFNGYLFVVDNLWCLHTVDLSISQFWGDLKMMETLAPVQSEAWLPVTHKFDVKAGIMGVKANIIYVSSVKYKDITVALEIEKPSMLVQGEERLKKDSIEKVEVEQAILSKDELKLQKLMEKEEMSNRDMIRMTRLMAKADKDRKGESEPLEIEPQQWNYTVEKDTSRRGDSIKWDKIRPIPLATKEAVSMAKADSLVVIKSNNSAPAATSVNKKEKKDRLWGKVLFGFSWRNDSLQRGGNYGGLFRPKLFSFNTVDGFKYTQEVQFNWKKDTIWNLSLKPTVGYAFNRKAVYGKVETWLEYAKMKRGNLYLRAGHESRDFNRDKGMSPFLNMVSSLLFKENYIKLYVDTYFNIANKIDLSNGLVLETTAGFQDMKPLYNSTSFSFIDDNSKRYTVNNLYPEMDLSNHRSTEFAVGLSYTPRYRYRIMHGKKVMVNSKYPTCNLKYSGAVPNVLDSDVDYGLLEGGINQVFSPGVFDRMDYFFSAGVFTHTGSMHFSNYKHFSTSEFPVLLKDWNDTYLLLDDYRYSSHSHYLSGHVHYNSPLLLLKHLPFFSNRLWDENIYLKYLDTEELNNYVEAGYGIGKIMLMGQIGAFVGFEDGEYRSWGVRAKFSF